MTAPSTPPIPCRSIGTASTRAPRCSAPGRSSAAPPPTCSAWFYQGGGKDFYRELVQDILGLNIVGFYGFPMPAQPLGWFKNEITDAEQLNGLKYRTVGLAADLFQAMGVSVTQLPGRRNRAGHGPRRHRRVRVQQPDLGQPLRRAGRGQELHARLLPPGERVVRVHVQQGPLRQPRSGPAGDPRTRRRGGGHGEPRARDEPVLDRPAEARRTAASTSSARRTSILQAQLEAWDKVIPTLEADAFIKKVLDSQRAWVERVAYYQLMNAPSYQLAYEHYFPGKIPA